MECIPRGCLLHLDAVQQLEGNHILSFPFGVSVVLSAPHEETLSFLCPLAALHGTSWQWSSSFLPFDFY